MSHMPNGVVYAVPIVGSQTAAQSAVTSQLDSARRGIGGQTIPDNEQVDWSSALTIESADNQRFEGAGSQRSILRWVSPGLSTVPMILLDQARKSEVGHLGLTAVASLLTFIRVQDDETDPADPGSVYAQSNKSSMNELHHLWLQGGGVTQDGIQFYLATEAGIKNDHHRLRDVTIDGYTRAGLVLEGPESICHVFSGLIIRGTVNSGTGQYGILCGVLPGDSRASSWASVSLKGGCFAMLGGCILGNTVSDLYVDSATGTCFFGGVHFEGSARLLQTPDPTPSTATCSIAFSGGHWITDAATIASDKEIVQHLGQGNLSFQGMTFGKKASSVELKFKFLTTRTNAGRVSMTDCIVNTPKKHGQFTARYPDDVTGSVVQTGSATYPLLYPWDGGRATPYTAAQWLALGIPPPRHWYKFQERDVAGNIYDLNTLYDRRDLAISGSPALQNSRTIDASAWDSYWGGYDGTLGQRFGLNDTASELDAGTYSMAYGATLNPVTTADDNILICAGAVGTGGLNLRIMAGGTLKLWCVSVSAVGAYDYRDGAAHKMLLVFNRTAGSVVVYTDQETITGTYNSAPGHVSTIGWGAPTSGMNPMTEGYIREAEVWRGPDAELIGAGTLTRLGWT